MPVDEEREGFVTSCEEYEKTFQTVLLRSAGLFEINIQFRLPKELKEQAEAAISHVLETGQINKRMKSILAELADAKIQEFEKAYSGVIEKKGGEHKGFMPLERDTLQQLLLHLMFEHFVRNIQGKRRQDFLFLFADQQNDITSDLLET